MEQEGKSNYLTFSLYETFTNVTFSLLYITYGKERRKKLVIIKHAHICKDNVLQEKHKKNRRFSPHTEKNPCHISHTARIQGEVFKVSEKTR